VLDADKLVVIGEIPNTDGVHGITIVREFGKGFTSNGRTSTVSIFDLRTLKVIGDVIVGKNPDSIRYDDFSKRVFVFNGQSHDATVIDASSGKVVETIPLGGKPEFAVTDGVGHVYVNNEDKSEVVVIDPIKLKVIHEWKLAPGEAPSGLAIDRKNRRLFSVCRNKYMIVLDADTGQTLANLPIGSGTDGCGFDPGTQLAYSSNGEGTLTVVHEESPTKFSVLDTITTQRGARTITVDTKTNSVFLPTAEYGPTPPPTTDQPRPRPPVIPGTFVVLKFKQK
jgi:YVTN family beta-propeller protein